MNCFAVTDFGALWHIGFRRFANAHNGPRRKWMKFNGSALQIHNCFNLLELRCIDLVTNINLIFDFPTTDVHSYFLFPPTHPLAGPEPFPYWVQWRNELVVPAEFWLEKPLDIDLKNSVYRLDWRSCWFFHSGYNPATQLPPCGDSEIKLEVSNRSLHVAYDRWTAFTHNLVRLKEKWPDYIRWSEEGPPPPTYVYYIQSVSEH